MSISGAQRSWHVRVCLSLFTVARHSKQTPIAHKGPRGSALTERRTIEIPEDKIAASTVVPEGTPRRAPFRVMEIASGMNALANAIGKIGSDGNFGFAPEQLVHEQFCRGQGCGDAEAFVTCGEEKIIASGCGADEREFIGSSGTKAGP